MNEFIVPLAGGNQMSIYEEMIREYLDDRCLIFNDEVGDNVIDDYIIHIIKWNKEDKNLPVESRKPIKLYITSPGGSPFSGAIMQDVILQSKTPIIGIALDLVASAAYDLFLACHQRYSFKDSCFLQHEGEIALENSRSKFKQTALFMDSREQRVKEFILSRTNMTEEFYDEVYDQEFWLDSKRAKELGVIHGIIGEDIDFDDVI